MIVRPLVRTALLAAALLPAAAHAFRISDPLAADPATLQVVVTLPSGFGILPGSAALRVTATNPRSGEVAASSDALAEAGGAGADLILSLATPAGSQFAALEATVAGWRADRAAPAARIDVTFTPCRSDPAADPARPMALSLQPAPGAPRLALVPAGTALSAYLSGSSAPIADCPK